ncbi:non-ribosomal peptide synthetase/type I polyketide synthase [Halodesulfovibrio sp.]|uniref:non-ribosomal peptide synthetase/type I polyketide synthase n=1 Tax=Halodesulfovibrio sp. TaxID=1912772 RepID=UPI0025C39656|nr:non-ribosomal peptide synthetase/type I polyketide synthase [Halodesulfovibrio sp.]
MSLSFPTSSLQKTIYHWLLAEVQEALGTLVCPETPLSDQGMSSVDIFQLSNKLEKQFSLSVSSPLAFSHPSISAMSKAAATLENTTKTASPAPAPARQQERIAIVGMSCNLPKGCTSLQLFWELLTSGEHGLTDVPKNRWATDSYYNEEKQGGKSYVKQGGFIEDIESFDADFFGISPREALMIDPQHRLLLETTWHAIEQTGISPRSLSGSSTGVFMGISGSDYAKRVFACQDALSMHAVTGTFTSLAAQRISYHLNLHGPSMVVDTASSASLAAIHTATQAIRAGECTTAIAGGVNLILSPEMHIACSQANLMADDACCKTFDDRADGYIRSEGCGVLILKSHKQAIADGDTILATIIGSAMNQDGQSNGITAPDAEAQAHLLQLALDAAQISQESVQYVEAHGTGTALGDPIELTAITNIYNASSRTNPIMVSSTKPCIGHAEAAAGIASVIKTILAMNNKIIPAHYGFQSLNHRVTSFADNFSIPKINTPWTQLVSDTKHPLRAGVSGFSIGGTNVHILLEKEQVDPSKQITTNDDSSSETPFALPIGATSAERLAERCHSIASYLSSDTKTEFTAFAKQSAIAVEFERFRTVVSAQTYNELFETLTSATPESFGQTTPVSVPPTTSAFIFSGQGAQREGMGKELYRYYPAFKEAIDDCEEITKQLFEPLLTELLFSTPQETLNETCYTQPALFAYEYALAKLLISWGVKADVLMGHSIGEYVAACISGVFSLEDALRLVVLRGKLIHSLPHDGGMLAVLADSTATEQLLISAEKHGMPVDTAARNTPTNTVLSGKKEHLDYIEEIAEQKSIRTVRLAVSHAFHSSLLEPILEKFYAAASKVTFHAPAIPLISNLTGSIADSQQIQTPEYWRDHLRMPVLFEKGIQSVVDSGAESLIEIGPSATLTNMGKQCITQIDVRWLSQQSSGLCTSESILLNELVSAGYSLDWDALYPTTSRVALAPTPFRKNRYLLPAIDNQHGTDTESSIRKLLVSQSCENAGGPSVSRTTHPLLEWVATELWSTPEAISLDRPLGAQGVDSLMGFRLIEKITVETGVTVPLSKLMQGATPAELIAYITSEQSEGISSDTIKAASAEEKQIANADTTAAERYNPFPLTDIQHAYWIGREEADSGNVSCHLYLEIDCSGFDSAKAHTAVNELIKRHEMLRAIIHEDGTQQILPSVPEYVIKEHILSEATEQIELTDIRNTMSHTVHNSSQWPLFELRASHKANNTTRLHISFDLLIGDGLTLLILARDLATLYKNNGKAAKDSLPSLNLSFRDCVLAEQAMLSAKQFADAEKYWLNKLDSIAPAPELPLRNIPQNTSTFTRRSGKLPARLWNNIKKKAKGLNITPSGILLAAFSEVLGLWSKSPEFSVTLTMFNRPSNHADGHNIAGDFTSALVHSMDTSSGESFIQRAQTIQAALWEDLEHRCYSGVRVLRQLRSRSLPSAMPVIFTSMLPITATAPNGFYPQEIEDDFIQNIPFGIFQTPQVHFDHQAWEEAGNLKWNWDTVEGRYPEGMLDSMMQSYTTLLKKLAEHSYMWSAPTPCELPKDQYLKRITANDTAEPLPNGLLQTPILEQIANQPDAKAIIYKDEVTTYRQLGRSIAGIANRLNQLGVEQEELVGIIAPKHWAQVTSTVAVMQAGAAYLPIDPSLPQSRIDAILEQGKVRIALLLEEQQSSIKLPESITCVYADTLFSDSPLKKTDYSESQLAYVIFTSGSTGTPKGVALSHSAARNTCEDMNKRFAVTARDAVLGIARLNFDLSVYDIFGALGAGGTLVLPEQDQLRNPDEWISLIHRHDVTLWNSVPAQMQMLVASLEQMTPRPALSTLRLSVMSGDWIPTTLPDRSRAVLPSTKLHSLGGATEAAIWSIHYPIQKVPSDWASIPYGTAMSNQTFHVLGHHGEMCPDWVTGELHIGGIGLANGYYGDAEKTNASFITHPETEERLYRTGDLGRWHPDGHIEFIGREDFQIKIRGHRIELGDIEATVRDIEGVQDVIALAVSRTNGVHMIALFVITSSSVETITEIITHRCETTLPDYMQPGAIIRCDSWPLTPSGKIDRKKLVVPDTALLQNVETEEDLIEVSTADEKTLQDIWQQLLNIEVPSVTAKFFALGGDSLLAIKLASAIRTQFRKNLPLAKVFELESIKDQATWLATQPHIADELPKPYHLPEAANDPFPLTEIQQAYWIGRGNIYALGNISTHIYLEIDSPLTDTAKLNQYWNELITHHPMLRAIVTKDGSQQILKDVPEYSFIQNDLRSKDDKFREQQLTRTRNELSHQVIETDVWPLFDIRLNRLDTDTTRIHISFDALCVDIWSLFLLLDEWYKLYTTDGDLTKLSKQGLSFRDYVTAVEKFRSSKTYKEARQYWCERVSTIPSGPQLPLKKQPSEIETPQFSRLEHRLDETLWKKLKERASAEGITPSSLLCAAYTKTIARWSKSSDFSINLTLFNRLPIHEDVNKIVGDFTSLTLLEVHDANSSFKEYAKALQQQLWKDLDHKDFSGVEVMREIAHANGNDHAVIPVVFTSALGSEALGRDASVIDKLGAQRFCLTQTPQVWLDHQVYENAGDLVFNWDYVAELFPENMIEDMFTAYVSTLEALTAPQVWGQENLVALPRHQEQRRIAYNSMALEIPEKTHHRLLTSGFTKMALTKPEQAAVVTPSGTMDYGTLHAYACTIAKQLTDAGVHVGDAVAVIAPRSCEQAAAVIGSIYAGCHYVPISPENPAQRTSVILENAKITHVLTLSSLLSELQLPTNVGIIALDSIAEAIDFNTNWSIPESSPLSPAYCIFTSGSTGTPKGVLMNHAGPCNTFDDLKTRFNITSDDSVLGLANLTFDLSVFDIFGILDAGGTLVFPEPEREKDPVRWLEMLEEHRVSIWNTVPMMMELLVEYCEMRGKNLPTSLRLVMMSGDWIPLSLPERIKALTTDCKVVSLGGATEGSIWSIMYPIETHNSEWNSIPYGFPMHNQSFHVLDSTLTPTPEWAIGELFIGGEGLAMEYLGDTQKTAEHFIMHPRTSNRLYRTGDLGFFHPDGTIRFVGRNDTQIKLRGHRIELGEIESVANGLTAINHSVAVVTKNEQNTSLVLYCQTAPVDQAAMAVNCLEVPAHTTTEKTRVQLTMQLEDALPKYMLPDYLVFVDSFPLTANGKVNRKQLPKTTKNDVFVSSVALSEKYVTSSIITKVTTHLTDNTQAVTLAAVIEEKLSELTNSPCHDHQTSFFELGANSLHLIRLQNALMQHLDVSIDAVTLFANPTIEQLATALCSLCSIEKEATIDDAASHDTSDPVSRSSRKRKRVKRHR